MLTGGIIPPRLRRAALASLVAGLLTWLTLPVLAEDGAPIDAAAGGEATVVASTVDRTGFEARLVAICETADGRRTIASSTDAGAIDALERGEDVAPVGASVEVTADGTLHL